VGDRRLATLFAEAAGQAEYDLIVVPVGVGSLAAAAARHGAAAGARVIGVEPVAAACLSAALLAGAPASVRTPGTSMAGLDCAEVSAAAWPALHRGIAGSVSVTDEEAAGAMDELAATGLAIGESGAAALAGLRALMTDPRCSALRDAVEAGLRTRALLIASEGITAAPEGSRPGPTPPRPARAAHPETPAAIRRA
jgi:diaminopropionate ammonia-lyase